MNNLKTLAIVSILLTTSCSLFEQDKKESPRIIYKSLPVQETVEVDLRADSSVKTSAINVPSVSEQVNVQPEIITINKETIKATQPVSEGVSVRRIRVEEVSISNDNDSSYTDATSEAVEVTETASIPSEDYGSDESQPSSDAEVGQCYGKVRTKGTSKQVAERVVVEPERIRKQNIPAKYKFVNDEVVVREEGVKYIEIPATYKTVSEQVVVEPEKKEVRTIPARYKTVSERVMVQPAQKVWKKGRGLIERRSTDGEIMCLVEEPAKYETVQKQVLVEAERQEVRIIPEVTKTLTREVIATPARVEKRAIPAVKKMIQKKILVEPATTVDVKIPAVYKTITKNVEVTPSKVTWGPVLCDYNITPSIVTKLQEALTLRGYDTGGVDGVFGSRTSTAIGEFQKTLGIESSGITLRTLRELGVSY